MRSSRLGVTALAAAALLAALAACSDQGPTVPSLRAAKGGGGTSDVTVTATDPDSATQDTTLDVVVNGSGFDNGSVAQWAIGGVPSVKVHTNSVQFVSPKKLVANITIAADADTGLYDVVVTTTTGKKGIGSELFAIRVHRNDTADPVIAYFGIAVVDADGSNPSTLSTGGLPSWASSGDGTALNPYHIVFESSACHMARMDVVVSGSHVEAANVEPLPTPALATSACDPAWSPIGDEIAFGEGSVNCPNNDCPRPSSLWVIPADPARASEATAIYDVPSSGSLYWPTWSPTAEYIAFVEQTPSAQFSMRIIDRGNGDSWVVVDTTQFSFIQAPQWARTRNAIAFGGVPTGGSFQSIYILDLDLTLHAAGPARQVVRRAYGPTWSPDDTKLAFAAATGGIRILDLTTGKTSSVSGTGSFPDWRR
jgi:hypothetical protein